MREKEYVFEVSFQTRNKDTTYCDVFDNLAILTSKEKDLNEDNARLLLKESITDEIVNITAIKPTSWEELLK